MVPLLGNPICQSPQVRSIAILGPGGVGGFLAAVLARAGTDVGVIGRERETQAIAREGISIDSACFGRFNARPSAMTELASRADVLLIATKATTLCEALERVHVAPRLVVPLLNGIEHMATVRSRFAGSRVAAGAIRMEADRPAPGRIVQSSPSVRIELGTDDRCAQHDLLELAQLLRRAGIPSEIGDCEAQVLWSKLVRLCALATITSAADATIGEIREDPEWRATLVACILEVAAVANVDGATIDPAASLAELDAAHPLQGSSMQRDIAAGREPELDAIGGAVLRAAARHGLRCPTIARLTATIAERAGVPAPCVPAAAPGLARVHRQSERSSVQARDLAKLRSPEPAQGGD
jgi:2-dehydropantoate 2-reductase